MEQRQIKELKPPLYDRHVEDGAKMVPFAGYLMPLHYTSALKEHKAVRSGAGLFDVSHMGRIDIEGEGAEKFLDFLSTNKIVGKPIGSATYTVLSDGEGVPIDDVIILRVDAHRFSLVANAANKVKVLNHLLQWNEGAQIHPRFETHGIIALQGPDSTEIAEHLFSQISKLPPMQCAEYDFQGEKVLVSATGYTGERGFEFMALYPQIISLWEYFTRKGAVSIGLAARDSLRLEMGFALYGHELSETITSVESVSAWTIKWDHDFLGREHLKKVSQRDSKRSAYGVILPGGAIAREGAAVYDGKKKVGYVTSGGFSPSLQQPIALILVQGKYKPEDRLTVEVRGQPLEAHITRLPFFNKKAKK